MIDKHDLFNMIFLQLYDVFKEIKDDEELRLYISDINPFVWKDGSSADPAMYIEFCDYIQSINEDDYGYNDAINYLSTINDGKFIKYFKEISKEEWIDWSKEYLKENYS